MKTILKSVTAVLGVLLSVNANAFTGEATVDGINYHIITKVKTAEVRSYYRGYRGAVDIPATIVYDGVTCDVTSIGNKAFFECRDLTSVTIPNSVTSIGQSAFYRCSGLTSVTIPNSVTSIGGGAFGECSGLTSVQIADLAAWCKIEFVSSQSNPLYEAHHLFLNGAEVKSLVIPNSVTSIGNDAFHGCSGLTSVTIPNSVTSIGNSAFYGCSGLASVTIPNSVISIGEFAFSDCSGLASVTIPNSVTTIGYYAFQKCSGLISVTIPNSVTYIDDYTFKNCSGLISVTIPNSVTSIGRSAFDGCSGLTSVTIPNSVTSIGKDAFSLCRSMTFVTIPNSVTSIGEFAFYGCSDITDFYCYAENLPTLGDDVFKDAYIEYATLHVPESSLDAYKSKAPWSGFGKKVAISGTEVETKQCETPTIAYENGCLTFSCATEGAAFVSEITDEDIKTHNGNEVNLTVTYNISVYATATGYENSEVATATLCWIDSDPKTEGIINGVTEVKANPVLIQSQNGQIFLQGVDDNTPVAVYTIGGIEVGSAVSSNGSAAISTRMNQGEVAIVKIGKRSVKVWVK